MDPALRNTIIAISAIFLYGLFVSGITPGSLFRKFRNTLYYYFGYTINRHFIIRKIDEEYKTILEGAFLYYHQLSAENKVLFEKRVQKFIDKKQFIPAGENKAVTAEMKTLIAASAVQITFGLPHVYFDNFRHIYVYPDFYYSEGMQQYNAGEVHKSGKIFLSWIDFLEGYLDPTNARNVGLHEMAHALRLENMIKNREYQYFKWSDIQEFNDYTVWESNKIKAGEESIFRPYAATYYHEFFAVVIEVFFEQPTAFVEYHPALYSVTCRLLRQDPRYPNRRIR